MTMSLFCNDSRAGGLIEPDVRTYLRSPLSFSFRSPSLLLFCGIAFLHFHLVFHNRDKLIDLHVVRHDINIRRFDRDVAFTLTSVPDRI